MTSMSRVRCGVWAVIVGLVGVSTFGVWQLFLVAPPATETLQREAEQAERAGDLARTATLADQILARDPHDQNTRLRAIRVAVKRHELKEAAGYLDWCVDPPDRANGISIPADYYSTMGLAGEAFFGRAMWVRRKTVFAVVCGSISLHSKPLTRGWRSCCRSRDGVGNQFRIFWNN